MTAADFLASLAKAEPPPTLDPALRALWWVRRGAWERAHAEVADDGGRRAAWVHAHLHRVEGDEGNARYWYARAARPPARDATDAEWDRIVADLLGALE